MDYNSLILFLTLLLLLAFFAGTEIPLMSVSAHKLDSFLKKNLFGAHTLKKIKKNNERLLITNLIGTTIVTIAISSLSTIVAINVANNFGYSGEKAVAIMLFFVSTIILLVGEIAPKILGVRYADQVSLTVAPAYRLLMVIMTPVNVAIEVFVKILTFFTWAHADVHTSKMSSEEFEAFIDMSREKGAVEEEEHRQIKNILELGDTEAFSVMTPRVHLDLAQIDMTVNEAANILLESSHTRLPVYGENSDDIDYVVNLREIFKWKHEGLGDKKLSELELEKIIKVPVTKPIDQIFDIFQKSHKHIALVLDEHGGVAGVITLEDIIEEVFGDIKDEKDDEDVYIRRLSNGKLKVKWNVLIEDILEEFHIEDLSDIGLDEDYEGETLSYVIISQLEGFPDRGEVIELVGPVSSLKLRVDEIDDATIEDVTVSRE